MSARNVTVSLLFSLSDKQILARTPEIHHQLSGVPWSLRCFNEFYETARNFAYEITSLLISTVNTQLI